ncbi:MAG: hypothetical protein RLZZ46_360 [Bacteroidota bacterium]
MKSLIFTLLIFCSLFTRAQLSNVIVYTESGERFSLALNGVIQNNLPGNNIRLTGMTPGSYAMSMIFEQQILGTLNWNLLVEPSTEATYCARRGLAGEWMVRLMNLVPNTQTIGNLIPGQNTVVYHASPYPGTTTTTTTTTYYNDLYNDDFINTGININIGGQYNETTTQTTYINPVYPQQLTPVNPAPVPTYPTIPGCGFAMDPASFSEARNSISSKNFESTRLQVAQQIAQSRCLTSAQVRDIMGLFSFESSKLEFAKFAHRYTFDTANYFIVNDAFTFSSSIDDLNRFLNTRR